jgi:hypothetical protein
MTKDDLQASGYLDADDVITAFRFEHADGLIPGTGKSSRWIKSSGGPDMWKLTLKKMTLSKAWNGDRTGLRAYVRVQKKVDAK